MRSEGLPEETECKALASLSTELGQAAGVSRKAQDRSCATPVEGSAARAEGRPEAAAEGAAEEPVCLSP